MHFASFAALLIFAAGFAPAQHARYQINAQTPEGLLLQMAGQESDEAKRLALYEEFLAKYPKHEGAIYAWIQAQPLMLKSKMFDKVISAAQAVIAAEPDHAGSAYNALQACEAKNDPACVILWSNATIEAARKKIASKQPDDEDEATAWKSEAEYAKQVITRCEYSFYAAALKTTDPKAILELCGALEKANPESQYLPQAGGRCLAALLQLKETSKALEYAENADAHNRANEDMLLFAADTHLTSTKDYGKAVDYARKLIAALPVKPAPEGMAAADWEAKKGAALARAYWIGGTALGVKESWAECDKILREGLKTIEASAASKDLLPGAYFYLGLSNYNLAKASRKRNPALIAEARKFWTACANMRSPFQAHARKNLLGLAAGK